MKFKFVRTNKALLILAVISFMIATMEGILYYGNQDTFFRVLLILQNSINAFAFKPTISLSDAYKFMLQNPSAIYKITGYAYGLAVFTSPYCTVAAVYRILERMFQFVFSFRKHKNHKRMVIFGYNNDVRMIIKNTSLKGRYVHIVSGAEISPDEEYKLSQRGCKFHHFDILKANSEELQSILKKAEVHEAEHILLFDDNSVNNFSILQIFSLKDGDGGFELKTGTKIICRCEIDSISQLIADYYHLGKNETYRYDLELISIPELQVRNMFQEVSLHSFYIHSQIPLREWNVRLLIAGFGSIGRQALLQAINLSVVHQHNSVLIDIFDENLDSEMDIFVNRLHPKTFVVEGNCIRLRNGIADGELIIRCYTQNVKSSQFSNTVWENNNIQPYTYAVITIDDTDVAVSCAMRLHSIFTEHEEQPTPVILRMDSDKRLADYMTANSGTFSQVRILQNRSDSATLDMILNNQLNQTAKQFHYLYSTIQVVSKNEQAWTAENSTVDELWRSTPMFKRDSSKALAMHEPVKEIVFNQLAKELNIPDINAEINSLIGENGSLMQYDGKLWRLRKEDDSFIQDLQESPFAGTIASLEHRRWCYAVASMGWKYSVIRNDARKAHNCLLPLNDLLNDPKGRNTYKYDVMSLMVKYLKK